MVRMELLSNFKRAAFNKRNRLFLIIFALCTTVFFVISLRTVFRDDDIWFAAKTVEFNLFDWIMYRWNSWSSRVFPEMMLWLLTPRPSSWPLLNTIVYMIGIVYFYKFYCLIRATKNRRTDVAAFAASCGFVWLLSQGTATESVFWLTGSVNYFWVGVLFLIAIYLPCAVFLRRKISIAQVLVSVIASAVTVLSHEQFGFILTLIYLVVLIYYLCQKNQPRKAIAQLALVTILLGVGVLCIVRASGSVLRIQQEINNWLPDMLTVPIAIRAESSIRWFMDSLINHTGVLLLIIWCLLCAILWRQRKRILAVFAGCFAGVFLLAKTIGLDVEFMLLLRELHFGGIINFHASWRYVGGFTQWIPVLFWSGALVMTIAAIAAAFDVKSRQKAAMGITGCLLAAIATAMLWASPTMYASGYRVVYVASLLLMLVVLLLIDRLAELKPQLKLDERDGDVRYRASNSGSSGSLPSKRALNRKSAL